MKQLLAELFEKYYIDVYALFDPCVIDPQELVRAGCHVDIVGLALCSFLVQNLIHSLVLRFFCR